MPELDTGEVTLYYETHGSGDPLVLIAGTGYDSLGWMPVLEGLAASRTVVAFDSRDVGRSSYVEDEYSPADMAADTAALVKALGIGPADVLGYSLGGAVAQELALAEPALVRRLVLCATWPRTDDWLRLRFEEWARLAELGMQAWEDKALADLFTPRLLEGQVDSLRALLASSPFPQRPDGFARQWRADQRHDAIDRLGDVDCPALVVGASEDVLVPVRYSRQLASVLPGAQIEVIQGAGHGFLLEASEEFVRIVNEFLGGHS